MRGPLGEPPEMPGLETLIPKLIALGLTRNEAVAYLTLLEDPAGAGLTGYEVAARSSIPRSAVYAVLAKLEDSGAAFATGSQPTRYQATEPDVLVEHIRRTTLVRLSSLRQDLRQLPKRSRPQPVWIVNRYPEVLSRIDTMIRSAEKSIYLSLWPRELSLLIPALQAVADRDLQRVLHSPIPLDAEPAGFSCWAEDLEEGDAKALWSHRALVVVDHREALIGGAEPELDNQAVWTTNPSLVNVATNEIILVITLLARTRGLDCAAVVSPMLRPHLPPES